jgi:hypothetical protein
MVLVGDKSLDPGITSRLLTVAIEDEHKSEAIWQLSEDVFDKEG